MAYNLTQLFNNNDTVKYINDYISTGVDGISAIGYKTPLIDFTDVCNRFQSLADPKFVNLRKTWGVKDSYLPFEVNSNLNPYFDDKFNSFSLKVKPEQIGFLRFPLTNNYLSGEKFMEEEYSNFEAHKKLLEKSLNIKIKEINNDFNTVDIKNNILNVASSGFNIFTSPVKFVKNTIFIKGHEETDKIKIAENKIGKKNVLVSNTCAGSDLSNSEKLVAVIDAYSKKAIINIVKKYAKINNLKKNNEKNNIIYASQLLTDIFVSLSFDMGEENNRQIDNALRLQLTNVLNTIKEPKNLATVSKTAHIATYAILKQLGLENSMKNIINVRTKMGTTYKTEPKNIYEIMFNPTQNNKFEILNNQVYYLENAKVFDNITANQNLNDLNINQTFPTEQQENQTIDAEQIQKPINEQTQTNDEIQTTEEKQASPAQPTTETQTSKNEEELNVNQEHKIELNDLFEEKFSVFNEKLDAINNKVDTTNNTVEQLKNDTKTNIIGIKDDIKNLSTQLELTTNKVDYLNNKEKIQTVQLKEINETITKIEKALRPIIAEKNQEILDKKVNHYDAKIFKQKLFNYNLHNAPKNNNAHEVSMLEFEYRLEGKNCKAKTISIEDIETKTNNLKTTTASKTTTQTQIIETQSQTTSKNQFLIIDTHEVQQEDYQTTLNSFGVLPKSQTTLISINLFTTKEQPKIEKISKPISKKKTYCKKTNYNNGHIEFLYGKPYIFNANKKIKKTKTIEKI